MSNQQKIRVGITHGDTNGIGYEVILKVIADPQFLEICTPIIYGSARALSFHRKAIDMPGFQVNNINDANFAKATLPNLVETWGPTELKIELGQPGKQAGQAAFQALERAVEDLLHGKIDVLVTAPINKDNIHSDQFQFTGHTDYLQACVGNPEQKAIMILCHDRLRVALATIHVPIKDISATLTVELLRERIKTLNQSLMSDFAIERPKIAVLGLNPHAGENGLIGKEDKEIVRPAIERAQQDDGILAFGPYAADGFFGTRRWEHFDAVLAMYHDQGLIPFKTLAMHCGVNFTAGLPIVRTSPDHGTGYDIAGKNIANEQSLREAIYLAIDVMRNRERYAEANASPLPKLYHDRGHGKDSNAADILPETPTDD